MTPTPFTRLLDATSNWTAEDLLLDRRLERVLADLDYGGHEADAFQHARATILFNDALSLRTPGPSKAWREALQAIVSESPPLPSFRVSLGTERDLDGSVVVSPSERPFPPSMEVGELPDPSEGPWALVPGRGPVEVKRGDAFHSVELRDQGNDRMVVIPYKATEEAWAGCLLAQRQGTYARGFPLTGARRLLTKHDLEGRRFDEAEATLAVQWVCIRRALARDEGVQLPGREALLPLDKVRLAWVHAHEHGMASDPVRAAYVRSVHGDDPEAFDVLHLVGKGWAVRLRFGNSFMLGGR